MMHVFPLVLWATAMACVWMLLLWGAYLASDEPALVDLGWASSIGFMTWFYTFASDGEGPRNWLVLSWVTLWSLRLTWLLALRLWKGQKDVRYHELSTRWRSGLWWKYGLFYQAQALMAGLLSIPLAMATGYWVGNLHFSDYLAMVCLTIGLLGETFADRTLQRFRANPNNRGKVCQEGLWRYSRHPNYFFEWMNWVGFALFAWAAPLGSLGWISPLLMYFTLTRITGIPPTENHLIRTRGVAYSQYQKSTSAFFPWPN